MQHMHPPHTLPRASFGLALCLLCLPALASLGCVEDEGDELALTVDGELVVSDKGEPLSADWALLPSAHLDEEDAHAETAAETSAPLGEASLEFTSQPAPVETDAIRTCTQDNDCFSTQSCECRSGVCSMKLIGPFPPAGTCDQAPVRSCSSASDCQGGCSCLGGACQPDGLSPQNPNCHLPPPDSFEYDGVYTSYSSYTGSQHHGFHQASDVDWVAVYIAAPGLVRFRTHNLQHQADTKIKVFEFDGVTKGALLGINDDIGGAWWIADSKSSRVDVEVPGDAAYLIEIVNRSPSSVYTDSLQFPEYDFTISYL